MKLIIFLFLLFLSTSLSKKSKHHHQSTSSDSTSGEELAHLVSDENHSGPKRFEKIQESNTSHVYFNHKGTLRRFFAIELSFLYSGGNAVCSPVSALLPLGKLILGAEGKTRKELTEIIGEYKKSALKESFTTLIKKLQFVPGVKLDVASRIYVAEGTEILPKFAESSKAIFQSGVEKISFIQPKQAADEINGWVSRQTNGMIPLLLKPNQITPDTALIIINAVYFKGKWLDPFKEINVGDFFTPTGPKKVQLMSHKTTCRYTKSDILNAEIIEIPYKGSVANFVIVLPVEKAGLPLLLNQLKLAPNLLNSALEKLETKLVDLTIPKFSISTSFDLKEMYEKVGVKEMTSHKSGLKNILKNQELKVTSAIQKAVIEVHERGTEAGAASAVLIALGARPSSVRKPIQFTADHPFLFYVQALTEQLFAGIFSEP